MEETKKKKKTFWKVYRIILLVLLVVVIGVWTLLWFFLDSYEKSQPVNIVKEVITLLDKGNVKKLSSYIKIENNDINTTESILSIIKNNISNGKYSYYVDTTNSTNKKMVYNITKNKEKFITVTLKLDSKRRLFNGKIWKVERIDKLIGEPIDINVSVPVNTTSVKVNGYSLTEKELVEAESYPEELKGIKDYGVVSPMKIYTVKGIYGEPVIEATINDKTISLLSDSNEYVYPFEEDQALLDSTKERIESFIKTYTRYAEDEANIYAVTPYLITNSSAHEFVKSALFYKGWVGNHTATQFSDITLSDMKKYSDSAFKVTANYSYKFSTQTGTRNYDSKLTMYWVLKDGKWLVGDLKL